MIKGIIFDLDGVIVSTDDCHYKAWQSLADDEGIVFNREINERLRGVSRMESLDIILERAERDYTDAEKLEMATRKNDLYRELIKELTPADILPGVSALLKQLRSRGILMAIGSSSKNSPAILKQIGLNGAFDAEADGNDISKSKPDPEVFLLAAERLGLAPGVCLVVEDADAGVEAGVAAGMKVIGVGSASTNTSAHLQAADLSEVSVEALLNA